MGTEVSRSRKIVQTSAKKNGKHLEMMSQGIEKDLKRDSSRTKTVKDEQTKSLSVFLSTKNMIKEEWYFNSGCSQHMTGNNRFLIDLQLTNQDWVILRDGGKRKSYVNWFLDHIGIIQVKECATC